MRRARAAAAIFCAAGLARAATDLLPAKVAEFARAVEAVRGHRFARPVRAAQISAEELKKVLRAKIDEAFPASAEETRRTLVAIGLIDDAPGFAEGLIDFYAAQVVAFYDPEPRRFFVVRGGSMGVEGEGLEGTAERLLYAHELTHALQDQELGLDRRMKELRDNGDRALALQSLLEGEATLVMVRVALADLPGADEAVEDALAPLLSAGALERASVPKSVPEYFVEQLFFPYVEGTAFVREAVRGGGWPAIDRLWKNPPTSTSEILHGPGTPAPASDLLPQRIEGLAPPGGRALYADTLGEWTLRFLLRRTIPRTEADAAAAGWRGDRVAFFSVSGSVAYLWKIRLESPDAAQRLEDALRKARRERTGTPERILREGRELTVSFGFPAVGGQAPAPGEPGEAGNRRPNPASLAGRAG